MQPIIELSQIKKEYKIGTEEIHALSGVSLNIYKNEYFTFFHKRIEINIVMTFL